jgi:hypothetical protein
MSVNHKLFSKIIKSKDMNKAIEIEQKKLMKQFIKMSDDKKDSTKEGFFSFKFYLLLSQLTTLKQMKDDPNLTYESIPNAGELWAKLYIKFLSKKYNNDKSKIISILDRDSK